MLTINTKLDRQDLAKAIIELQPAAGISPVNTQIDDQDLAAKVKALQVAFDTSVANTQIDDQDLEAKIIEIRNIVAGGAGGLRIAASRGILPNATRQATAANLMCGETRMSMKTGGAPLSEMRFVFAGFTILNNSGVETNLGNDQTIEVAVEGIGTNGTIQVTFGGTNVGTIVNGVAALVSDPVLPAQFGLAQIPANTQFFFRSRRTVALNGKHAKHGSSGGTGEATFYSDPAGGFASQLLGTGVMAQRTGGSTALAELGPAAILGVPIGAPDIAVLAIGDSIIDGSNDANIAGDGSNGGGWVMRGMFNVNGRTVPMMKQTVGGSSVQNLAAGFAKRAAYWGWCTHAIMMYGTNDLAVFSRTAAQTLADIKTAGNALKAAGIRRFEYALFPPRTTSTDSFATAANQTPLTDFQTGGADRDALNTAVIASVGTNGLDAILDMRANFEDATLPDRYIVNGTANFGTMDGVHPQPAIHTTMGAVFASRAATWS